MYRERDLLQAHYPLWSKVRKIRPRFGQAKIVQSYFVELCARE